METTSLLLNSTMLPLESYKVATLFHCNTAHNRSALYSQNTLWKQTMLGCKIIQLLQDVYPFNVSYVYQKQDPLRDVTTEIEMYQNYSEIDFYARPMSLRVDVLELARPIGAIFNWNFGFIVRNPERSYYNTYSKPFTRRLWNVLYAMAVFCSIIFYLLKRWEDKVKKNKRTWECSYGYELLMVIGAYCQHIPPMEARLMSRRTAYYVFFIFAYIVYTYYTSNLLSHLVNDKRYELTLEELLESDIECVILENVKVILNNNIASIYSGANISATTLKLQSLRPVTLVEGLRAVKTSKTALLSDFVSIAPYMRSVFTSNEICNLKKIEVASNVMKYLFVSKTFLYTEQFKVSILRVKEAGLLGHLVESTYEADVECTPLSDHQTHFLQVMYPIIYLGGVYVLCILILGLEILYARRCKLLPYVN